MEEDFAPIEKKTSFEKNPLFYLGSGFIVGIIVGAIGTYFYFSFFGKPGEFDYSKVDWFQKSTLTPTISVYENPFKQPAKTTPDTSPQFSPSPTPPLASPTYINPFDLIGQ